MRRYALLVSLVVLGVILFSCGQVQSFETSSRAGTGWRAIGPEGISVKSLAISPGLSSDHTLFVGLLGWDRGIFHSTDRGDSWRQVTSNLKVAWGRWVSTRLVVSPSFSTDGTLSTATLDGLLRSTDRGYIWRKVYSYDQVLEGNFEPWVVLSPSFVRDKTLFTSKVCEGVFCSADGGETWREVTRP